MNVQAGDRVRITGPMDDPDPLPTGLTGTVQWLNTGAGGEVIQIDVEWDNGRSLMLLPEDPYEVIDSRPDHELVADAIKFYLDRVGWSAGDAEKPRYEALLDHYTNNTEGK